MINKSVKSFLISDTLSYSASSLINVFLTFLIADKITQGRIDIVGFLISYYLLFMAIVGLIFAKKANIKKANQKKHLVTWSLILYGLLISLMGFSSSILHIAAILSILAVLDGILYPLKWDVFSKILDKGNEVYEWSLEGFFTAIAASITAAAGGFLAEKLGLESVFIIFGIFYVVSGIAFYQIITAQTLVDKIKRII